MQRVSGLLFLLLSNQRYLIFWFPRKVYFSKFLVKMDWINEKAVFFSWPKNKHLWYGMNEWHVNFSRKKKKKPKMREKKHNSLFNKIIETLPDFEWMAYELFLEKKNKLYFFFPAQLHGLNEWMSHELLRINKKNTVPLFKPVHFPWKKIYEFDRDFF